MRACISVDVETDWGGRSPVESKNIGIDQALPQILQLFKKHDVLSTFFITSNLLPKYHSSLQNIARDGHEIGCHGHDHSDLSLLSLDQFRDHVDYSATQMKKYLKTPPKGFRAPQFKIHPKQLSTLSDLGFSYDSSLSTKPLASRHKYSKILDKPHQIHPGLLEIPISNLGPVAFGLLWSNLFGKALTKILFSKKDPLIIYLHPFDIVPSKKKSTHPNHLNFWYNYKSRSALAHLEFLITFLKKKGYSFCSLQDIKS